MSDVLNDFRPTSLANLIVTKLIPSTPRLEMAPVPEIAFPPDMTSIPGTASFSTGYGSAGDSIDQYGRITLEDLQQIVKNATARNPPSSSSSVSDGDGRSSYGDCASTVSTILSHSPATALMSVQSMTDSKPSTLASPPSKYRTSRPSKIAVRRFKTPQSCRMDYVVMDDYSEQILDEIVRPIFQSWGDAIEVAGHADGIDEVSNLRSLCRGIITDQRASAEMTL